MTVPGSTNPLLAYKSAGAAAYTVSRSLRFNSADSAYLSRTPASAGNRKTWTWSGWVKRGNTAGGYLFGCDAVRNNNQSLYIDFGNGVSGAISVLAYAYYFRTTTPVFRDPSAWYHVVIAVDTTQATANNRIRIYVNGSEITTFSTLNNPALNDDLGINQASAHRIGDWGGGNYWDGYLAEIHFIDGQQLTPSSFAETNATTGQWVPKSYAGTYGTNGFKLTFSDNSNTTAATLGADTSGNGNNWTPSGFSVTAGAGNDSLRDTPTSSGTDTGVGGEVTGNYATFSPTAVSSQGLATLANGNLDISGTGGSYTGCVSTIGLSSGKWYWEYTPTALGTASGPGIIATGSLASANPASLGYATATDCWWRRSTFVYNSDTTVVTGLSTIAANDVINIAVDFDAGKLWFGRNGTWESSGNPASGTNATVTFTPGGKSFYAMAQGYANTGSWTGVLNAGARAFAYTAPSGFKALCDTNLTAPTIALPNTVMDTVLYTGTGASLTPTSSLGFSPDLVWIKSRSAATDHAWYDTVRGVEKRLEPNTADAEVSSDGGITAFNSAGFTVGTLAQVNTNAATYVAWAWDAASSDSTNTDGTTTSTIRVNTSAGFSIATYSGANAVRTVGHGLGVAPAFMLVQPRNVGDYAYMYHSAVGNTQFIYLGSADAPTVSTMWNNTTPTSSVFSLGSTTAINSAGVNAVAYCWAPVAGYSSFGSYTGNGSSTDGPFIYLGFRAAVIIVRRSSSTGNWTILDDKREGYNVDNDPLYPNRIDVEGTTDLIDITSNGFKVRTTDATFNASGSTYIYAAWASAPFPYSRAR